jgi:hypothetical protein
MTLITNFRPLRPMSLRRAQVGLALVAGVAMVALHPSSANAQFWGSGSWYGGPRPWGGPPPYSRDYDEDRLRPGEIADVLRNHGWSILSPPAISGRHYVANVRNGNGQRLFVVLDAYDGRILDARQVEERPNTNELAAIPDGVSPTTRPDEVIRPVVPQSVPPTPAPRPRRPSLQAKHVFPPSVKSTPLGPPKEKEREKEGTIAVAKPSAAPPAVKPAVPIPSAPEANGTTSAPASPSPGSAPSVRQVYPPQGGGPGEPQAHAPQSAEATAPATPPPAAPKPVEKPVLPPDAGFE